MASSLAIWERKYRRGVARSDSKLPRARWRALVWRGCTHLRLNLALETSLPNRKCPAACRALYLGAVEASPSPRLAWGEHEEGLRRAEEAASCRWVGESFESRIPNPEFSRWVTGKSPYLAVCRGPVGHASGLLGWAPLDAVGTDERRKGVPSWIRSLELVASHGKVASSPLLREGGSRRVGHAGQAARDTLTPPSSTHPSDTLQRDGVALGGPRGTELIRGGLGRPG